MSRWRDHFDALAPRWESFRSSEEAVPAVERGLDRLGPIEGCRAVDVGCGTGALLGPLLARLGTAGRVVAIDGSGGMLAIARARHPDARIEWREVDLFAADLEVGVHDLVLCFDSFAHFAPQERALAALAGWLAPGGRLLVWHDIGRERLAEVHRGAGPPIDGDLLPPIDALARLARSLGLEVPVAEEDEDSYTLLARRPGGARPWPPSIR